MDDERAQFERNRTVNHTLRSPNAGHLFFLRVSLCATSTPSSKECLTGSLMETDRCCVGALEQMYIAVSEILSVCVLFLHQVHSWKQQQSPQLLTASI